MSYYGQPTQGYGYQGYGLDNGYKGGYGGGGGSGFNPNDRVIHMRPGLGSNMGGGPPNSFDAGGRGRLGLGANDSRDALDRSRQNVINNQPPTREEIARTIFVGGLGDDAPPDEVLEIILKCVGKLRRWQRARDAKENKCRFGFAEYEDVDSLEAAKAVFDGGFDVPTYKDGKIVREEGDNSAVKMMRVLAIVDEQSSKYIEDWMGKRGETESQRAFRHETAKDDFRQCIASLVKHVSYDQNGFTNGADMIMFDAPGTGAHHDLPEALHAQPAAEDELADIPAEMRAQVAQEIRAFRDRALRLDVERTRKEDEVKAADLARSNANKPYNRLASPPPANGTGVAGAPSGPKGFRGVQIPSNLVDGVPFVKAGGEAMEMEDDSETDDLELENRRQQAKQREQDKLFAEAEERWLRRETTRLKAGNRAKEQQEKEDASAQRHKEQEARRLENWDDEEEAHRAREDFYFDRSRWASRRARERREEARKDDADRRAEQEELAADRRREEAVRDAADQFLEQAGAEIAASKQVQAPSKSFKMSLGGLGQKREEAPVAPKRTIGDLAGFLDDEESANPYAPQRATRAINQAAFTDSADISMTDDDRAARRKKLAAEIPSDTSHLFAWEVRWSYIDDSLLEREIRPFVNKKVLDYLGVQEDFLVDLVIDALKQRKAARELVAELEPALEDEAEVLVKKVWRLVVFWAEAESRGLN